MRAVIEIEMDNEAFVGNLRSEAARILAELAAKLRQGNPVGPSLYDVNGNRVGKVAVKR